MTVGVTDVDDTTVRTSLTTRRLRPSPGPTAIAAKRSTSSTTSSAQPILGNGTFTASTGPTMSSASSTPGVDSRT